MELKELLELAKENKRREYEIKEAERKSVRDAQVDEYRKEVRAFLKTMDTFLEFFTNEEIHEAIQAGETNITVNLPVDTRSYLCRIPMDEPNEAQARFGSGYIYKNEISWIGDPIQFKLFKRLDEFIDAGFYVEFHDGITYTDHHQIRYINPYLKVSWDNE